MEGLAAAQRIGFRGEPDHHRLFPVIIELTDLCVCVCVFQIFLTHRVLFSFFLFLLLSLFEVFFFFFLFFFF